MLLNPKLYDKDVELKSAREGFSEGLVLAADENPNVVGMCADLTESIKMDAFRDKYPKRFFEMGICEQSMASVASGMAAATSATASRGASEVSVSAAGASFLATFFLGAALGFVSAAGASGSWSSGEFTGSSAMIQCTVKLCLLLHWDCAGHRPSCAVPCGSGRWFQCVDHGREVLCGDGCHGSS